MISYYLVAGVHLIMYITPFCYFSIPLTLVLYFSYFLTSPVTGASLSIPAYCVAAPQTVPRRRPHGRIRRSPSSSIISDIRSRPNAFLRPLPVRKDNAVQSSQTNSNVNPRGNGICYFLNNGNPLQEGIASLPFTLPAGRYALKFIKVSHLAANLMPIPCQ